MKKIDLNKLNEEERLKRDRLWKINWHMKQRCYNEKHHAYKNYGAKGIKVCDEWQNYDDFILWGFENGYEVGLTIDRINPNEDYKPSNCEWVTRGENTRRSNKNARRFSNNGDYYGISPTGEKFIFKNASQFAKENNLNGALIRDMANGRKYKNSLYNGWKFGFVNEL